MSLLGGGVASSITPALSAVQTNQQQDAHTLVRPSSNHEAEPAATTQPQAPSLIETCEEQLHVHSDDSMAPVSLLSQHSVSVCNLCYSPHYE